jgi:hypothetical protein
MIGFCKNEDCPPSAELVDFQNDGLGGSRAAEVRSHLSLCEFCEAEAEFYSNFPQGSDEKPESTTAQIPAPLFELAEALLRNRHADGMSLNSLLKAKGKLVTDNA